MLALNSLAPAGVFTAPRIASMSVGATGRTAANTSQVGVSGRRSKQRG